MQTITALAMLGTLALGGGCAAFADEPFPPDGASYEAAPATRAPAVRAQSERAAEGTPSDTAASERPLSRHAPSEAPASDEVRAWKDTLDAGGWTAAASSADGKTVTFRRPPEHRPDGTVVMWERYERRDHESGQWRSLVAMSEYDCQEGRARTLQETTYTEPNLSGRAVTASTPSEWTYPIPGSMMEGSLKVACEPAAAANRARAARSAGAEAAAAAPPAKGPKKAKAATGTATPAAGTTAKATSAKAATAKTAAKKKKKPPPPPEPAAKHIDIPLAPPT